MVTMALEVSLEGPLLTQSKYFCVVRVSFGRYRQMAFDTKSCYIAATGRDINDDHLKVILEGQAW